MLSSFDQPPRVVIYGAGPQAVAHVHALTALLGSLASVSAVVRNPLAVRTDHFTEVLASGTDLAAERTAGADIIVCATTARTPLFDDSLIADHAIVVAVGSHEADARELPGALLGRADVIVEDPATALRECGDIILAIDDGDISPEDLIPMADIVTGARQPTGTRPLVFKSSGMSWEDLVIAEAVLDGHSSKSQAATQTLVRAVLVICGSRLL